MLLINTIKLEGFSKDSYYVFYNIGYEKKDSGNPKILTIISGDKLEEYINTIAKNRYTNFRLREIQNDYEGNQHYKIIFEDDEFVHAVRFQEIKQLNELENIGFLPIAIHKKK